MEEPNLNPGAATGDAVTVSGLHKRLGSFRLRDIDLALPTGYVTGLVGPNGSGKTSLVRALLGLIEPDSGEVTVLGGRPGTHHDVGAVLDQITAAPEWRAGAVGKRIGALFPKWDEARFRSLLDRFDVPGQTLISGLSRGQTVKLSMAMALAHDPRLLILDEPSSGLDPVARRELGDVIREFVLDPGHTVLFSTHITTDLDNLADHIVVMSGGTIAHRGTLDETHEQFATVQGPLPSSAAARGAVIGLRPVRDNDFQGLIRIEDSALFGPDVVMEPATTDDIVVGFAEQPRPSRTGTDSSAPSTIDEEVTA